MLVRDKGFTLIELMVAVAILAIIASFAIPSASEYIDKRKIINAAEAVYGQLQFARSQAISRSARVYSRFGYSDNNDATTWLMGVSTTQDCDLDLSDDTNQGNPPELPDASNDCTLVVDDGDADNIVHGVNGDDVGDLVYYTLFGADFNGVELDADGDSATSGGPNQISFDPRRGTASNETVFLTYSPSGGNQYELQVRVSVIGRVRICTPGGASTKKVPGYTECPVP